MCFVISIHIACAFLFLVPVRLYATPSGTTHTRAACLICYLIWREVKYAAIVGVVGLLLKTVPIQTGLSRVSSILRYNWKWNWSIIYVSTFHLHLPPDGPKCFGTALFLKRTRQVIENVRLASVILKSTQITRQSIWFRGIMGFQFVLECINQIGVAGWNSRRC